MKVVLDTNILISAFVYGGKPRRIFEEVVLGDVVIGLISDEILEEFDRILKNNFGYSKKRVEQANAKIRMIFEIVKTGNVPNVVKEDHTDDQILAAAISGQANYIVSGDKHLLSLKKYRGISIVTPAVFLKKVLEK